MRRSKPGWIAVDPLDRAERPGREPDRCHRGVLDLEPDVGAACGERLHRFDRAEQPLQQVDGVNRLVHQRAAAVQRLGAVPTVPVVAGRPAPLDDGVAGDDVAEPALLESAPDQQDVRERPGLKHAGTEDAGGVCRVDDAPAAVQRHLQRFLHEQVLAGGGGGKRRFQMSAGRRADADGIQVRVGQERVEVAERGAAVLLREPLGAGGVARQAGRQACGGDLRQRPGVHAGDQTGPDDAEADRRGAFGIRHRAARSPARGMSRPPTAGYRRRGLPAPDPAVSPGAGRRAAARASSAPAAPPDRGRRR